MADLPRCDYGPQDEALFGVSRFTDGHTDYYCLTHFMEFAMSVLQTVESELSAEQRAEVDRLHESVTKSGGRKRASRPARPAAVAVDDQPHLPKAVGEEEAEEIAR